MKRILLVAACAAVAAACTPDIEKTEAPNQVVARFDPSKSPAVVPTPNDLAFNPVTGTLGITPSPTATASDIEFTNYLNTLNGFPASSTAKATFTGKLDATTVTTTTVRVFDITDSANQTVVADAAPVYNDQNDTQIPAAIEVARPIGWQQGRTYLIAIVGGPNGVKGANGETVVASTSFNFLKQETSLVSGCDLTKADAKVENCKSVTSIIPTSETDPAKQVQDRNEKAARLEGLRLKYKPSVEKLVALGVSRADLALLWTFKISNDVAIVFDPAAATPKVPRPNDLAISRTTGLVTAPIDPSTSLANQEFTRDYLNSLNGFPITATASAEVAGGDLDPATVTAANVRVLDLTPSVTNRVVAGVTISYDSTAKKILIRPPATGWQKAHQYAAALISGNDASGAPTGLLDTTGKPVVASQVWALVRAEAPVDELTLVELSSAQLASLTQLQAAYKPLIGALLAGDPNLTRENIVLGWTFRTLNHPEATFNPDPAAPIIPFPNSLAMKSDGGVNLTPPAGASPLVAQLIGGLNTLNGFSLTAPIVSENSTLEGAFTERSKVDATTLDGGWIILPLSGSGLPPRVQACISCASSTPTDGGVSFILFPDGGTVPAPDALQFVPQAPLAENTTYGLAVKTSLKDTTGRSLRPAGAFALLRMENTLVTGTGCNVSDPASFANCKSAIDGVPVTSAIGLEPVRLAHKPFIDALVAAGIPRKEMALAWTFKTQTVMNGTASYPGLRQLHDVTSNPALSFPNTADFLTAATLPAGIPNNNIGTYYQGSFKSLFLLTNNGTFGGAPRVDTLLFNLAIPGGNAPTGGWPVVIFHHGLGSSRHESVSIMSALATAGFATILIDAPFHGDRSSCAGVAATLGQTTDDAACANPSQQRCDNSSAINSGTFGFCINRTAAVRIACTSDSDCTTGNLGRCLGDNKCAGGDFGTRNAVGKPAFSGWNFLNTTNLFITRDNFRQQVVDLGQLARVIAANPATAGTLNNRLGGGEQLNAAKINYAGISLGGILGSLYVASAPEVHRAVLNVPGADLPGILLSSPAFAAQRAGFLATLSGAGIAQGTPNFDQFLYFARMILDPADPQNAGFDLTNSSVAPTDRAVFIQYITNDGVVPNSATDKLIAAATRTDAMKKADVFQWGNPNPTEAELPFFEVAGTPPAPTFPRHSFLLNFRHAPTTVGAQTQLTNYLNGTLP